MPVTGTDNANKSASEHETAILADLVTNGGSFVDYRASDVADWVSVFGKTNADFTMPDGATLAADDVAGTCQDCPGVGTTYPSIHGYRLQRLVITEWKQLFGGEVVGSQKLQDGHCLIR